MYFEVSVCAVSYTHLDVYKRQSEDNEDEESEIKISHGVELVNPVDSWEENWLFQRRKLKPSNGTCQPVPCLLYTSRCV